MTIDTTKLRAETLALIDGTTPGPWRTNATILHGKKYGVLWVEAPELIRITGSGGSQSYTHVVTDTQIHDDNDANARLIAAAPTLAADTLRLMDEIERLNEALRFYANSEIYKPHPHGPAFDRRDISFVARAALSEGAPA